MKNFCYYGIFEDGECVYQDASANSQIYWEISVVGSAAVKDHDITRHESYSREKTIPDES